MKEEESPLENQRSISSVEWVLLRPYRNDCFDYLSGDFDSGGMQK